MSQGLKPASLPPVNVRAEAQTYLRSNSNGRNKNSVALSNFL
jgi:hypothetical protein